MARASHPERDVKPGKPTHVHLDFELPAEDGRYQVLLSPMRENVCWYYEQGWPFLLVESSTRERRACALDRVRVTTRAVLARERACAAWAARFVLPVPDHLAQSRPDSRDGAARHSGPLSRLVRRRVLDDHQSAAADADVLLRVRRGAATHFPSDPAASDSPCTFLAGMLPWLAFSEAVGRAPSVMLEHRNFVKKLVFAVETLPVNLVAAGLVTEFFAVVLYCGFLLVIRHALPGSIVWLPLLLIPQLLFTAGMSWFLAALGVFVRDLGQIIGFVLTLWFFLTPICYPENKFHGAQADDSDQESDLHAGARLSRDLPAEPRARFRAAVEALAAGDRGISVGARVVLQAAQVVPGPAVETLNYGIAPTHSSTR